ncbi:peptidase inhibitor family I36 protein [Micromonospora sp. NPDC051925]|uniref:peptidase inhibitor family I36 protein n=1 Tax=Micromonospora sp. NPDC051925 TaxID=3364288 RepID=UPI0037C61DA8
MRISKVLLAGAVIAAGGLAFPAAASAGNPAFCGSNLVCIYDGNNWVGFLGSRGPGGGIENVSAAANDHMDSWENRTSTNAAWYYDHDGGGACVNMSKLSEDDNINVFDSDELSSWRTDRGC